LKFRCPARQQPPPPYFAPFRFAKTLRREHTPPCQLSPLSGRLAVLNDVTTFCFRGRLQCGLLQKDRFGPSPTFPRKRGDRLRGGRHKWCRQRSSRPQYGLLQLRQEFVPAAVPNAQATKRGFHAQHRIFHAAANTAPGESLSSMQVLPILSGPLPSLGPQLPGKIFVWCTSVHT
jgi:hypothetical protein